MLHDDQVRELYAACVRAVGRDLPEVRGRLATPRATAAAIWELLVLDSAFAIATAIGGTIDYERPTSAGATGGPDVRLDVSGGRPLWLEATYRYRRITNGDGTHARAERLSEEAPRSVEEHPVYLALKKKAKQHSGVPGPYVVCVGSDQSPAVGRRGYWPDTVSERVAVTAAFEKYPVLSGAMVVSIGLRPEFLTGFVRAAQPLLYINSGNVPLTAGESVLLRRMDFNRWKYSRSHEPRKPSSDEQRERRKSGGSLVYTSLAGGNYEVEVSAHLVTGALAGETSLSKAYGLKPDHLVARLLSEGWEIVGVRMIPADLRQGEPARVVFELSAPAPSALYPSKRPR